jgi:hypothetical protein
MIIALTLYHEGDKIYINLAHIIGWIEVNDNVTDDEGNPQQIPYTKIELDDNSYIDVSETPEEIVDMIRGETDYMATLFGYRFFNVRCDLEGALEDALKKR